jgi:hypothetical protein
VVARRKSKIFGFPEGKLPIFRLTATDFIVIKSAGDQGSPLHFYCNMEKRQSQRNGPPLREARVIYRLAAAVVVALAATAAAVAATLVGSGTHAARVAAAAEEDEQNDDPQTVVAAEAIVVIHRITSRVGIWSGSSAHSMLFRPAYLVTAREIISQFV